MVFWVLEYWLRKFREIERIVVSEEGVEVVQRKFTVKADEALINAGF